MLRSCHTFIHNAGYNVISVFYGEFCGFFCDVNLRTLYTRIFAKQRGRGQFIVTRIKGLCIDIVFYVKSQKYVPLKLSKMSWG